MVGSPGNNSVLGDSGIEMSMTFKLNQRRQESKSLPIITYANNEGDQATSSGKF